MHPIHHFNAESEMSDPGFANWMFGFFSYGGLL